MSLFSCSVLAFGVGVVATLDRTFYTCPMSIGIGAQDALFAAGGERKRALRSAPSTNRLVNKPGATNGHFALEPNFEDMNIAI